MYIHMLGYPTHFGQMETLKLIAASGFPEKVGATWVLTRWAVLCVVDTSSGCDHQPSQHQGQHGASVTATAATLRTT
jgi:hypothetical protein